MIISLKQSPDIRAVTLDVGNTLLFPAYSVPSIYFETAVKHGVKCSLDTIRQRIAGFWPPSRSVDSPLIFGTTHEEAKVFWRDILDKLFFDGEAGAEVLDVVLDELYDIFGRADVWTVNESLEPFLAECKQRGIKTGIISNWDIRLRSLLKTMDLIDFADSVVVSAEHGIEKPDPGIFQIASTELGIAPEHIIHVGDTWEDDVLGAMKAGMQSAWYRNKAEVPDCTEGVPIINNLMDLIQIIDKL